MSKKEIETLKSEIKRLKDELHRKEESLHDLELKNNKTTKYSGVFSTDEIVRYSRQMIMPNITVDGQRALKNSKVLIVGAGGLGCPAALYLASAGIGEITLMDYDEVELSNLHRQILHTGNDINRSKVESAFDKIKSINSCIKVTALCLHANSSTIKDVVEKNKFDVVVDGSDNVPTRYLLNDICVMNNIPLVSGSALQMEGQLTVYNYRGGPCYRCVFPVPPPPETVTNCGDGGVLGPVPGVIGVLQALETIKIITNFSGVLSGRLLLFDGSNTVFQNVKLRERNLNCNVCGENPSITALIDYAQFCGSNAHDKVINIDILCKSEHIDVKEFSKIISDNVVLDVRPEFEYQMCHLDNTVNVPFSKLERGQGLEELKHLFKSNVLEGKANVYVLCRRGNDSQRAIGRLKQAFSDVPIKLFNVKGGLHAYSKVVDPDFPVY